MSALSSPPGHAIEWIVYPRRLSPLRDFDEATFVRAATWFEARSLGMAATGLGPDEIVVKDWPLGDLFRPTALGAKREQLTAELRAATEKPKASKGLDALFVPVIRSKADAKKLLGEGSHWVPMIEGLLRRGRVSGPVLAVKVK